MIFKSLEHANPRVWAVIALAACPAVILIGCDSPPVAHLSFDGKSSKLSKTQIVPTLDTPIESGKNVVWCASFQAGWKKLEHTVFNGPVKLSENEPACDRLNQSFDPATDTPPGSLYANAGFEDHGIVLTIQNDMKSHFPNESPPTFPNIVKGSCVMYGFLQARVPFKMPYFENRESFEFTSGDGKKSGARSFGIRKQDRDAYGTLRRQVEVLFYGPFERYGQPPINLQGPAPITAFALDLSGKYSPSQLVVACVNRKETLADTLESIDASIAKFRKVDDSNGYFSGDDAVLVPEIFWRCIHEFGQLKGKHLDIPGQGQQEISTCIQEIQFRLDRSGAEISSEAEMHWASKPAADYLVNRPFLVYAKLRSAQKPYFVMWVDNSELLLPW